VRIRYVVGAVGVPVSGPSGASAHVRDVTAALAGLGHAVDIVAACGSDRRGVVEEPAVPWAAAGIAGWPSWLRRWAWMREVRTARRVARWETSLEPPDLVWERYTLFSAAGARIARRHGIPWVLEVNAPLVEERRRFEDPVPPKVGVRWERRVLRSAPCVVAVSRWLVHWLVDEVGCDASRVFLVPNGVVPVQGDRAGTRASMGLAEGDFVLGFLGSFRPWHGTGTLLPLLEKIPDARLLLVGDAPPELRHHPRVTATGRVTRSRVPHLVAAMDVGLAPYPADAPPWFCPLKLLDYRAQGTPAVATDVADCRSLVEGGGEIVPAGDGDALVAAVLSWRGRRTLPRVRSWSEVAREVLQAVSGVSGG